MRNRTRPLIALGVVAALGLGASTALIGSADAASQTRGVGLSSNGKKLTLFDIRTGARKATVGNVTGLVAPDTKLVGIDFRVQDHAYYVVGNAGGVYKLATSTGKATKTSQLSVALDGTSFGVDVDPADGKLRIVSDTGQNLVHDLSSNATVSDKPLTYDDSTKATGVTALAYTNNDVDTTNGTTLLDLDTTLDKVAIQLPGGSGALSVTGPLGVHVSTLAGFDIQSTVNSNKRTVTNTGYATLRSAPGSASVYYKVDLLSGKATKIGTFSNDIADIAVPQP